MQQVYYFNTRTNIDIRYQLQNNSGGNSELASIFGITQQTLYSNFDLSFGFRDCLAVKNGKIGRLSTTPFVNL